MRTDVCLILEGTYPYVAGGVSTWVAQILAAMPQISFSLVYIGPRRDLPRELKYRLPPNVVELCEFFVHDYPLLAPQLEPDRILCASEWQTIGVAIRALARGEPLDLVRLLPVLERFPDDESFFQAMGHSRQIWDLSLEHYAEFAPLQSSFIEFFWSHRFINLPAFNLLRAKIPEARVYHAACTGYAGLLAAKASQVTQSPFLLSEHGIYTRERRIEIFNAEWIRDVAAESATLDISRSRNFYKEWWVNFFLGVSRTAYDSAEHVFALFEANRRDQVTEGAPADRIQVISNGIEVNRYLKIQPSPRRREDPLRIGFIGRITRIKDIKTLLRSLEVLRQRQIDFSAVLMGPLDEEEDYAAECLELSVDLKIEEEVHFAGRVDVMDHLADLDVVVLTSVSEGLPFVILEANCAGLPVVATDVGACRELLQGRTREDRALGESGLLAPVGSPVAFATALERLALHPDLGPRMGGIGRERVRRFYDLYDVMSSYRCAYEAHLFSRADLRGGHPAYHVEPS